MTGIELRNQNGTIVGYDTETGEKIPVTFDSLETGDLTGSYTRKIRIFDEAGGTVSLDIDDYSNPIQEAWDQAPLDSMILYPPTAIEFDSTLTGGDQLTHIGQHGTEFVDTDETTPSYELRAGTTDGIQSYWENIKWSNRTTPRSAPGFVVNRAAKRFDMGPRMTFHGYDGHDLWYFDDGHLWESTWLYPSATGYDRFLHADDLGAPFRIHGPGLGSSDETTPEIQLDDVGVFVLGPGWNKGGTACQMMSTDGSTGQNATYIGTGNYEPGADAGAIDNVWSFVYQDRIRLDQYKWGGNRTVDNEHVVITNPESGLGRARKIIAGGPDLGITVDVNDPSILWHGVARDVNNRTGSPFSSYVTCLMDLTKKASTGTGYDGGTVDSRL